MNLICMGSGSPTVILESGLGTHAYVWSLVQYKIARTTQTCAYERAGMGVSDEGRAPRDAASVDADLQALLRAGGLKGPYVLVGHSVGGYFTRLYADLHPKEVAGVVLIDPSIDRQKQLIAAITGRPSPGPLPPNPCAVAAEAGQLKPGTEVYKTCVGQPPDTFPAALRASIIAQEVRAATYRTMAAEADALDEDTVETLAHQRRWDDMPLIVLTAGQAPKDPGLTDVQNQAWAKTWMQAHDDMAALSTRGRNRVVAGSGHFIQFEQPQAVIDAVDEVVMAVRSGGGR